MCACLDRSLSHTHTVFSDRQAGRHFLLRFSLTCYSRKRETDGLTRLPAQWGIFPLRSLYPYTSAYLSQVSGQRKEPRGQKVSGSALRSWHALYPFQFRQVGPHGSETGWGQEKGERQLRPRAPDGAAVSSPWRRPAEACCPSSFHSASWQWVLIPHWISREITVNPLPRHTHTHTDMCRESSVIYTNCRKVICKASRWGLLFIGIQASPFSRHMVLSNGDERVTH